MQGAQQINAVRGDRRKSDPKWRHHAIVQTQLVAALQFQRALVMDENAVAGGDPHASAAGGAYLEELFLQRVADNALDASKTHLVVVESKAQDLAQIRAGQLVNVPRRVVRHQCVIDEAADAHHAHTVAIVAHENVFVAIHAHDDDAVIAQFLDVEVIAADAAAERGDQRSHLGRCQHLVEARLLDVQDLAL